MWGKGRKQKIAERLVQQNRWYSEASSLLGHAVATPRTKVRAKAEERTVAERGVTMQIGYSKIRSDLVAGFVKHILQTGSSKNRVKRKS